MSLRVDTSSLIPGSLVCGDSGHGVLAEMIPSGGDSGPGYAYDALLFPADNGKEVRGRIVSWPLAGTLTAYEDTSFTFYGPDGDYSFAYQLYLDGVAVGTPAVVTLNVGAITNIAASGDFAPLSLTAPAATAAGSTVGEGVAAGALPSVTLTAPAATAAASATADGSLPIIVFTAPAASATGTAGGEAVASGAFAALGITPPAASASSTSQTDAIASGSLATITITAPQASVPAPFVIPAARRRWTNLNGQDRPRYLN